MPPAEYADPPLWSAAPVDGQVPVYNAATDRLMSTPLASVGLLTVPQTHIAQDSAISAETAVAVTAANAATQSGSYVQADVQTIATLATANKAQVNALVTDVGTLVTEITALRAIVNTLLTELQTAGVLS